MKNIINSIINKDCIEEMKKINDNSIDLIIADPPYNLSKGNTVKVGKLQQDIGMGGKWNKVMENWDNMPFSDYIDFTIEWLTEAKRILKDTGSMWIFGTYHNIGIINFVCQLLEIEIINEVIWYKRNSIPNLSGRRLTASHENIIWCHKGDAKKRKYYFDYEFSKNGNFEEDLLKKSGKQMRTVWDIPNNKEKRELEYGKHPTQKPLRLLKRMINLSSKEGDICLSPFSGAGSECLAAKELNRKFIGFEIDKEYYEICLKRLNCKEVDKKCLNQ